MRRAQRLAAVFAVIVAALVLFKAISASQLQLGDALFLTKNSIKQYRWSAMCKSRYFAGCSGDPVEDSPSFGNLDVDLDSPFTNVVNLVFPIDLIISYNYSNQTQEMVARYASFSPIIGSLLTAEYAIVAEDACDGPWDPIDREDMEDKILIVLRGKCTFVRKILNLLNSDLRPRAIVVANDEPYRALITMYLASFNADGKLRTPVLFILNEDYRTLDDLKDEHLELRVRTAAFDNWLNLLLSMAVSPPLLILLCYLLIRTLQMCRRRRVSAINQRLVKNLPVYIYHRNHLVPTQSFYYYLTATYQTGDIPLVPSSSEDVASLAEPETPASMKNFVINGTDLYLMRKQFGLLFAPEDFFPTFKCPICLDKFTPLQLRVLVLDCHHIFHEKCLSNWLINFRRTCPLCNDAIRPTETLPLLASHLAALGALAPPHIDLNAMERTIGLPGCSQPAQTRLPEVRSTAAVRSLQFGSSSHLSLQVSLESNSSPENASSNSSFVTSFSQQVYGSVPQNEPSQNSAASSLPSEYFTPGLSVESRYEETDSTLRTETMGERLALVLSRSTMFTASSSSTASTIRMN